MDPVYNCPAQAVSIVEQTIQPRLDNSYALIHHLFDEHVFNGIVQDVCKTVHPEARGTHRDTIFFSAYTWIEFDSSHKLASIDSYFNSSDDPYRSREIDIRVKGIVMTLIERFARELKLVGEHEIQVDWYRIIQRIPGRKSELHEHGWHFDTLAKITMVAILQNSFQYAGGEHCGLELAENLSEGPFSPEKSFNAYIPSERVIHVKYPLNGAAFFKSYQGRFLHTRSPLLNTLLEGQMRNVFQIKLKDSEWNTPK